MRESRPYGSERGALSNGRPYRDRTDGLCSAIAALPSELQPRRTRERMPRLTRPGGTCTHWKAPPSHGARKMRTFRDGGAMYQIDRGCAKTSARFRTDLFRSLLRGLKALRIERIAKNFALLDPLQIFAEFLHGLDL